MRLEKGGGIRSRPQFACATCAVRSHLLTSWVTSWNGTGLLRDSVHMYTAVQAKEHGENVGSFVLSFYFLRV